MTTPPTDPTAGPSGDPTGNPTGNPTGDARGTARHPRLAVRVPGSTSNLGPGFDLLGLALDLFVDLEVRVVEGPAGAVALACDDPFFTTCFEGALGAALRRGLELTGVVPPALEVRAVSEIPPARGLGSSGAVAAGGVLLGAELGRRLGGRAPARAAVLEAAVALDGHPDNAVASLVGGCTLALRTRAEPVAGEPASERWRVLEQPLAPDLLLALAWPTEPLATPTARAVLGDPVPFADAVDQPRRLAALLAGLASGDAELLRHGLVDHLHEARRLPLIAGAEAALAAARDAGALGATLSGSGSALVAICRDAAVAAAAADAMGAALAARGPLGGVRVARAVHGAPTVVDR